MPTPFKAREITSVRMDVAEPTKREATDQNTQPMAMSFTRS